MLNVYLYPVTRTPSIIHQDGIKIVHTKWDGIIVVIDCKLVAPVAANCSVEKPFTGCLTDISGIVT